MKLVITHAIVIIVIITIAPAHGSNGDRSQFFMNCLRSCADHNCTKDGLEYAKENPQPPANRLLLWSCRDECKYHCMWRTTNAFLARDWQVPQFYGKWPFIRMVGLQEPASVLFSVLNFLIHIKMMRQFRRDVRKDSPMYYVWHTFCGVCLNGWIWSAIFHTRDYPLTELLDYSGAYSIVLATLICSLLRMAHNQSAYIKGGILFVGLIHFSNYFMFLGAGRFDYSYNMKANIVTGILSGVCWLLWYFLRGKRRHYGKKIVAFFALTALSLVLEVNDFPPIFWIFDAHALWHLATVPITVIFYRFLIDDCKHLRNELFESKNDDKEKLI